MSFDPTESNIGVRLPASTNTETRLTRLEDNQIEIGKQLDENTKVTVANHELLTEMSVILDACKLGLKIIGSLGKFVKWAGSMAVAALAFLGIWNAWHK